MENMLPAATYEGTAGASGGLALGALDVAASNAGMSSYGIIGAACKVYQYILIDCGTYLDEAVAMSLNVADIVVVVPEASLLTLGDSPRRV